MSKPCPTPSKRRFETQEAAGFFARADGMRAYRCRCGFWHLTSKNVIRKRPFKATKP